LVFSGLAKLLIAAGTVVFVASAMSPASALSADVAKKCRELMVKAFPPLVAGSSRGNAQEEREYFRTCVAQGGKMGNAETPSEGRGK
jgi:hypothetical protein